MNACTRACVCPAYLWARKTSNLFFKFWHLPRLSHTHVMTEMTSFWTQKVEKRRKDITLKITLTINFCKASRSSNLVNFNLISTLKSQVHVCVVFFLIYNLIPFFLKKRSTFFDIELHPSPAHHLLMNTCHSHVLSWNADSWKDQLTTCRVSKLFEDQCFF